jgi:hypothetical protein
MPNRLTEQLVRSLRNTEIATGNQEYTIALPTGRFLPKAFVLLRLPDAIKDAVIGRCAHIAIKAWPIVTPIAKHMAV